MTKYELASYLTNLISIMESKEDGGIGRGRTLGWEYNRAYAEMMEIVRKEQEDESRNRK